MLMVAVETGQTPLPVLHCRVVIPFAIPVNVLVGFAGAEIEAAPEITLQVPVPTAGGVASRVEEEIHSVWDGPATAVDGESSRIICTLEVAVGQEPLVTDHTNSFVPVPMELMTVVWLPGDKMLAFPVDRDHVPVPVVGEEAAREKEVAQMVWFVPAIAGPGCRSR